MKKLLFLLCIAVTLPFLLCSCFDKEIEEIFLSEAEINLTVGESAKLTVTATPDEVQLKKLSWESSDKSVATVEDGEVKAKSSGVAVISVKTENGISQSCRVEVQDKKIEAVIISDTETSVKKGSRIQLSARLQPADAPYNGVEWSSADESIATVNSEGFVEGKRVGVTDIICTAENGMTASCRVTVKSGKPIQPTSPSAVPDESTSTEKKDDDDKKADDDGKSDDYSGDVFPDSSVRLISESEVAGLSSSQAQAAINEIFARNGYIFKSADLQAYYSSKSWYKPDPNFSESRFNSIESRNIALFSKYR